ncbi:hypothetical protein N9M41_04250 [Rhodopirellula sp.]|jgi:hypothetical protein|nr:hypothetical protein [Rhodopirellula sp.]
MTQMMLFDAPVGISTAPVLPAKDTGHQEQGGQVSRPELGRRNRYCTSRTNHAAKTQCEGVSVDGEGDVQRMGDLARLVLLRYDLMAKRRAHYAARRCAR